MKQTSEHTVLTVHTGEAIQEDYKGPGAVYHGYLFQPDAGKRVYTGEQCRTELDRVRRMGIRLVRTYYNYDMVWYKGEWNWESPAMTGFYRWLGELKEMGVKVIVNAAWNCPGDINSSQRAAIRMVYKPIRPSDDRAARLYQRRVPLHVHRTAEARRQDAARRTVLSVERLAGLRKSGS